MSTYGGHSPRNYIQVFSVLAALTFAVGCTPAPKVYHTSISGEIRQATDWRMVWADSAAWLPPVTMLANHGNLSDANKAADFCRDYLGLVGAELHSKAGLTVADNLPLAGTIELYLVPYMRRAPVATPNEFGEWQFKQRSENRSVTTSSWAVAMAEGLFSIVNGHSLRIYCVYVDLRARDGSLYGECSVVGQDGGAVQPKHVAKAIQRLISKGRYK